MSAGVSLKSERDILAAFAAKPLKLYSFQLNHQVVLIGPNIDNPELLDAAILWTDIRLCGLDPTTALGVIGQAILVAALVPRLDL